MTPAGGVDWTKRLGGEAWRGNLTLYGDPTGGAYGGVDGWLRIAASTGDELVVPDAEADANADWYLPQGPIVHLRSGFRRYPDEDITVLGGGLGLPLGAGWTLHGRYLWSLSDVNPTTGMDPMQAKMMQYMPLVFGVMFAFFPAGLVLYWVTNGALGLLQQWWMVKRYSEEPVKS